MLKKNVILNFALIAMFSGSICSMHTPPPPRPTALAVLEREQREAELAALRAKRSMPEMTAPVEAPSVQAKQAIADRGAIERTEFVHGLNLSLEEQAELSKILADASESKQAAEIQQDLRELEYADKIIDEYQGSTTPLTSADRASLRDAMAQSVRARSHLQQLATADSDENGSDAGSSIFDEDSAVMNAAKLASERAAKNMFNQNMDDQAILNSFVLTVLSKPEFKSLSEQDIEFLKGYFLESVWRLQEDAFKNLPHKVAKIVQVVKYVSHVVQTQTAV